MPNIGFFVGLIVVICLSGWRISMHLLHIKAVLEEIRNILKVRPSEGDRG